MNERWLKVSGRVNPDIKLSHTGHGMRRPIAGEAGIPRFARNDRPEICEMPFSDI